MRTSGKAWGQTTHIIDVAGISLHRIEILPGGFCSVHSHAHKCNAFYVESGALIVSIHRETTIDVSLLGPGDLLEVEAGLTHQFRSDDGCTALEVYYAMPMRADDIQRQSTGGISRP
jgi:mannose-6-phosphate isomerase-like protein (cupin superfamily)